MHFSTSLPNASKARTNGVDFFTNFQVTVLKPTPVNPELKAAIEREQAAIQNAQATQAQGVAEANAKKAKAEADLAAAVAETQGGRAGGVKARRRGAGLPLRRGLPARGGDPARAQPVSADLRCPTSRLMGAFSRRAATPRSGALMSPVPGVPSASP